LEGRDGGLPMEDITLVGESYLKVGVLVATKLFYFLVDAVDSLRVFGFILGLGSFHNYD
jgi:uncharacterized membrane protein